jgi:uncharacterized protein (DUF169 family)
MGDYETVSRDLVESLDLQYQPVGVTLYMESEPLPADVPPTEGNFKSYCQALVLAGEGRTLDDGVLEKYGVGLFGTEEASAETILKSTYLDKGKTKTVFIAPLSAFQQRPQVVVFAADSEQVMWLLYAVNYEKGGSKNLPQSGGALGGCSDITALPILKGVPNVTFLGLGCRVKSSLGPCHLMMGTPASMLETIHSHVLDMAKPIAMLKKARSSA